MELTIIHACLFLPTHSISMIKAQLPISYNGRHTVIILSVCMDSVCMDSSTSKICMHTTHLYAPSLQVQLPVLTTHNAAMHIMICKYYTSTL